jgi:hypothetical protein
MHSTSSSRLEVSPVSLLKFLVFLFLTTGVCFGQSASGPLDVATLPASGLLPQPLASSVLAPPARESFVVSPPEPRKSHLKTWWLLSGAALVGASMTDLATSANKNEANPLLRNSSGQISFDRAVPIKLGLAGVTILVQSLATRHRPSLYRESILVNLAGAGVFTGTAFHNGNQSH